MAAKDLGDLIAGFAPEGPLRTIVYVAYGLCAAIASLVFAYYLKLLAHGGAELGSIERHDYERLRASLKEGNLAAQLYVKWLTKFLDWIEDFFGDAGMADRTLFPHAFGLKTPAPLWTARALDRCLLLALIYPFATIFLIWAISGHVGPAEHALGLLSDVSGPWRALFAVAWALSCFRLWRTQRTQFVIWLSAFAVIALALAIAFAVVVHGAAASALGVFVGLGVLVAAKAGVELTGAAAFSFTILLAVFLSAMIALDFPLLNLSAETIDFVYGGYAGAFVGTVVTVCAGAIFLSYGFAFVSCFALGFSVMFVELPHVAAIKNRFEGVFFSFFLPAAILVSLFASYRGLSWGLAVLAGPVLLFLGLLTLLNAPFDWASVGLTRALLRRGLELGGWWPTFLAIVDACLAGIIIAFLAVTMVLGVQAFDELAVHGGGTKAAVLPLDALFDGIAKNPGAPEYWWAYALLLSTMIPSLINLAIGGMALTRGIPGVPRLLLHWIPEGRDVPDYRRPLAALVLTGQMFAGALLGIAAQVFLAWGLLYYLMPAVGLDLLWLCQQLAALDLPGKFFRLTGIIR